MLSDPPVPSSSSAPPPPHRRRLARYAQQELADDPRRRERAPRRRGDDAPVLVRRGRRRRVDHGVSLEGGLREQLGEGELGRHPGSRDGCSAGASIGLEDVAIDPKRLAG